MASVFYSYPMPSEMVLPCFMPASQVNGGDFDNNNNPQSDMGYGDDPLDFDLLAEYLLDEGAGASSGFDFCIDTPPTQVYPQASAITPDLTTTTMPDTLLDGPMFNIHSIQPPVHSAAPPVSVSVASMPMMLPLAPAPLMSARPSLAGIAPAPPTALSQQMIVNQHKRPRLETNSAPQALHMSAETMASIAAANQVKSGRQKSQVQVDRRRERNRILARRTRLRKKFFFESLQKDVMELQRENIALKEIVRTSIEPTLSKSILDECTAHESLPDSVLEQCGDPSALDAQDFNLMSSIRQSQQSFIITDPSLQDNPIVYASDDFLQLTGYSRDQVLGRNCRFLQGTDTNPEKVAQIRKAVANGEDVSVTFINYMADGTAFWNKLFIAALRDAQNNIVNFIGVTVKVAGPEPGDPEAALAGQYLANGLDGTHANEDADISGDESVDADAAVMAIEGAVDKAVAAAPTMTKTLS